MSRSSPSPRCCWLPAAAKSSGKELILATTTSTQDSGLLDVLVPMYEQHTGDRVKVIAVGSGAALELGRKGNADVLLVHSPAAEEAFVKEGAGIKRTRVMYNDFLIVGPAADPAKIKGLKDVAAAMKAISTAKAPFYSRGDNSGTHSAELALWKAAAVEAPKGQPWYAETGQGMGATLTVATEKGGYTVSDRATWLANADRARLPILVEGDSKLFNVYHVIPVNPEKHSAVNRDCAEQFRQFMVAKDTLAVIGSFGKEKYGAPLFVAYAE
ncbi:MAG: substrate-binding domain-containing protein [Chloroflexi bacterium]|nr:substrate-binding domain-containing protein [Chloroflexota bacterium]